MLSIKTLNITLSIKILDITLSLEALSITMQSIMIFSIRIFSKKLTLLYSA